MTLTLAQAITVAILAASCFFCGWFLYRLRAKAREAVLQKVVLETKGMIPQLESTVRNRELRIATLTSEVGDWKSRIPVLESGIKDKERELLARDRALRALNTELTLLKDAVARQESEPPPPVVDEQAMTELRERLAASERRCSELADQLTRASTAVPGQAPDELVAYASMARDQAARIQALEAELAVRDRAIADLEERIRAESAHGHTLSEKLDAQDTQIQLDREQLAKWRARVPKLVESLKERDDRIAEIESNLAVVETARSEAVAHGEELESALTEARAARLAAESDAMVAHEASKAVEERATALAADVERLRTRQRELEAALAERTSAMAERDEKIAALSLAADESRKEYAKKLATSIRLGREEIDRMNGELGSEVDRLTRDLGEALTRRNDADEALAEMRGRFEAQSRRVDELLAAEQQAATVHRELEARILELEGNVERADSRTAAEQARLASIDGERQQALGRISEFEAALAVARGQIEAAAAETAAAHKQQLGLDAECEHLRQRLAEAAAEQRVSFERARDLEAALESQRASVDNAAQEVAEAVARERELEAESDRLRQTIAELEVEHRASAERAGELAQALEVARSEAHAATQAAQAAVEVQHGEFEAECNRLRQQLSALEAEHRAGVDRMRELETALDAARTDSASAGAAEDGAMRARITGLEAECEILRQRLSATEGDLRASLERLNARDAELSNRASADSSLAAELEEQKRALATLATELEEAGARAAPLESLVAERDAALRERGARIAELEASIAMLESSVADSAERIATLERESSVSRMPANEKVEYLEQRVAVQFEKNREIALALEERERKLAELERDRLLKEKSLTVLQQQLELLAQANERLSIEVRDLKAHEHPGAPIVPAVEAPAPEPGDGNAIPEKPQGLFSARPDVVDDLQQIRGIGAAFEHRLNALGIYQYKQIAALNDAEIVWVENELHVFRGRVGRDDWIGQALDLLAGKIWRPGPAIDAMTASNSPRPQ